MAEFTLPLIIFFMKGAKRRREAKAKRKRKALAEAIVDSQPETFQASTLANLTLVGDEDVTSTSVLWAPAIQVLARRLTPQLDS